jgi:small subunit ribosomal protein S20
MPNIKSSKKRAELSRAANVRNRAARARLRTAIKRVRAATDPEGAQEVLRQTQGLLDQAAASRLVHPNRAARLKGQLARYVDSLSA